MCYSWAQRDNLPQMHYVTFHSQNSQNAHKKAPAPVTVRLTEAEEFGVGQRIGITPDGLDFGAVPVGTTRTMKLRIANLGFAELLIIGIDSDLLPHLATAFVDDFDIPPFGFVELLVLWTSEEIQSFTGNITVMSDDPARPLIEIPVLVDSVP